jgi:ABC-2 type transport system permease protein
MLVALIVICCAWPAILSLLIYLPHNLSFLKLLNMAPGTPLFPFQFDARFFVRMFMVPQGWWSLFFAFIVGPELISADLRNNALPLYLSRPLSRLEYVLGKATVLTLLLSAVTWIPGLALFALQAYLQGWDWFTANLRIGYGIVLGSAIYIALLCLVSLALSAYIKWRPLARLAMLGVFFVAAGFADVLNLLLGTEWLSVLNLRAAMAVVWAELFGVKPWIELPAAAAWLSLLVACAASAGILSRKLRAYEVVR